MPKDQDSAQRLPDPDPQSPLFAGADDDDDNAPPADPAARGDFVADPTPAEPLQPAAGNMPVELWQ